jgi:ATP-dependent exoDNAse (exonuclease V) beta subunit
VSARAEALRREDGEARSLAQREYTRPLVLEAGAGTGKTATLVARVVVWCLGPGWERAANELATRPERERTPERVAARVLRGVVAITFTEAAAAEMALRVERALAGVEDGELVVGLDESVLPAGEHRVQRAAWLRDVLDQLPVQTIHAYARRLLTAHPFEAGLHPSLEVDAERWCATCSRRSCGRRTRAMVRRSRWQRPASVRRSSRPSSWP